MFSGFNHSHDRQIQDVTPKVQEVRPQDWLRIESYYPSSDKEGDARQSDITLDYYQHPDKLANTTLRYSAHHDLYSLGCVLLEIELWETLNHRIGNIGNLEIADAAVRIRALAEKLDRYVVIIALL